MIIESDVCIVGGGITAAMIAEKLSDLKPGMSIVVVEAGSRIFDLENRMKYRQRNLDYGENAWPGDFIDDQAGGGIISRTMAVGGSARPWDRSRTCCSEGTATGRRTARCSWPAACR